MELLKRCWLLVLVLLAVSYCTEARTAHARHRRDDSDYAELQGDAANDDVQGDDGGEGDGDDDDSRAEPPATLLSVGETFHAKPGQTAWLPCNVQNPQSAVVMWQKGEQRLFQGSLVVDNTKIRLYPNSTIEIPQLEESDAGEYTCMMMASGRSQSIAHTLNVVQNKPPRIVGIWPQGDDRRVVEGSDLKITCRVDGFPKPSLHWSKIVGNQNQRVTSQEARFEPDSILLRGVRRQHSGTYICLADNGVGQPATGRTVIQVLGKPRVHVHKSVINGAVGVTAVLGCTVHDEPRSLISWLKDGQLLEDSADVRVQEDYPHSTVTIHSVKDKDFGNYTCQATNQYGSHNRSAVLVQEPVLEDLRTEGDALTWQINSHTPLSEVFIQYRRIDEAGAEWTRTSVETKEPLEPHKYTAQYSLNDIPTGKYEAIARARNQYGWSEPTPSVFFEGAVVSDAASIQAAGVGANLGSGSGAENLKSSTTVLSTVFMCLLIRFI